MIVAMMAGCSSDPRGADMFANLPTAPANGANEPVRGPAVTGSVNIRQRIALPPNAVVTISLSDISLADAPSKVLAQKVFRTEGLQAPFMYTLPYEPAQIPPQNRIIVSATVSVDGRLMFITDTVHEVINNNAGTQKDLVLVPAAPESGGAQMHDKSGSTGLTSPM